MILNIRQCKNTQHTVVRYLHKVLLVFPTGYVDVVDDGDDDDDDDDETFI